MNFYDLLKMGGGDTCGGSEIIFVLDVTPAINGDDPKLTYVNRHNLTPECFQLDPDTYMHFKKFIRNDDIRTLIGRVFLIDFDFCTFDPDEDDSSEYFDVDGGCVGVKLCGITEITAK